MPAGRLRRAGPDRSDDPDRRPPRPGARGADRHAVTVRGLAAVRLRRRVHVRGRQPAGRTARRRTVVGHHTAGRADGPGGAARAAGRRRHRHHGPPAPAPHPGAGRAGRRSWGCRRRATTSGLVSRHCPGLRSRRDRTAQRRRRCRRLAGRSARRAPGADGVVCGTVVVGGRGGHRPVARRRRCRGAGRGARDIHRVRRRPTG